MGETLEHGTPMNNDDDFIPTSTWEDLLVARGYPQDVIDGMKKRRQEKEARLFAEMSE